MSRRLIWASSIAGACAALAFIGGCGGSAAPCPASAAVAGDLRAKMPVAQQQREATVLIQAALPEEVRDRFIERVIASKIIPDEWGKVGVGWSSRGSGFFIKAGPNKDKIFAITNHHVVAGATTVTVKLTKDIHITNCTVAYTDDYHDIAVVALPDDVPAQVIAAIHFVDLAARPINDNEAVHASGYPAVGSDQSYRLTPGTVSNASFKFKIAGREEPFIQHTAAIDHGSSGGPLFGDKIEVLGMNTLSIPMDQNLYCAVPASMIHAAVEKALHVPNPADIPAAKTQINETCKQLIQELSMGGNAPLHTSAILSDAIVADQGIDAWERSFTGNGSPERMLRVLHTSISHAEAMPHLRPMLLAHMFTEFKDLGQGSCTESSISQADVSDFATQKQVRQRVDFAKGGFRTFYWKLEQGHWRLNKYD